MGTFYSQTTAVLRAGGAMVATRRPLHEALVRHAITDFGQLPYDMQRLVDGLPAGFAPLPDLTMWSTGGPLSQHTLTAVRERLTPRLLTFYGSNEVGLMGIQQVGASTSKVFRLLPGVQVRIVDAQGRLAAPGEFGRIAMRSNHMCDQYVGDPQASAAFFQGGWFFPADTGRLVEGGSALEVAGRNDEVLNIGGLKIPPEDLESVVRHLPGIADAGAAQLADDPQGRSALLVMVASQAGAMEQARSAIGARLGPLAPQLAVRRVLQVPRTDTGKVRRNMLPGLPDADAR